MRILELVIAHWVESFFIIGAGLGIINIHPRLSKLAFFGVMFTLTVLGVRGFYEIYNIPYGTHSFFIIAIDAIILRFIGRQKWHIAIISLLISFLLLTLGEGVVMFNVFKLLNISINDMLYRPGFRFLGTILSCIPAIVVFIVAYIYKFSIIDLNRLSENEEI